MSLSFANQNGNSGINNSSSLLYRLSYLTYVIFTIAIYIVSTVEVFAMIIGSVITLIMEFIKKRWSWRSWDQQRSKKNIFHIREALTTIVSLKNYLKKYYMHGCFVCVCLSASYACSILGGWKRLPDPLEQELQTIVSLYVGAGNGN